jgi:hypothetical protein
VTLQMMKREHEIRHDVGHLMQMTHGSLRRGARVCLMIHA